ncbi:hypothetical protein D9M71_279750 [compost metagenome]
MEDQRKGIRDGLVVHGQHHHGAEDVDHAHQRYQGGGDLADAPDAAEDDQADQHHADHAGQPGRHAEGAGKGLRHAVDLDHVADAEAGETAEQREGAAHPRPLLAQAVLDRVHRPADVFAALVLLAVVHGEHHLAVLGGHADQRGAPHPEDCPGAAEEDRGGDAGDIAGADGGGQTGHQRLERADLAGAVVIFLASLPEQAEGSDDPGQRHEFQPQHEEQAGAEDEDQHGRPPDQAIETIHHGIEEFHQGVLFALVDGAGNAWRARALKHGACQQPRTHCAAQQPQ